MNWDDLRYFLAAVRGGTFSAAAEELAVNRTTVARRITQLERRLGQALFVHQHNQYQLSQFGEELYRQASRLEKDLLSLEEQLGLGEERLEGQLRIAAPLGLGPEFINELSQFSLAYPQVRWELLNTLDPIAALNHRKADVAIAVSNTCPPHIRGHFLGEMGRAVYASKSYLKRIPAETPLAQHHWIGWGKDLAESQAAKWIARELPDTVYKPAEVNSWNAILAAVKSGLGVAHLWCFLADSDRQLTPIRPPDEELSMGLWLMRPANIPANARVKAFITTLRPLLKQRLG
ncbi:DNA-binding transcriptional LysR family regulator [Litorivivens lipolytica]|uniref:DNA-binding transcriptional LysR family regulator n=1 Tax=Litorivivens lipolytica TaxID=1524264 RepID=A0A7W4W589_9GAMM|nr:LysR family transcriptional regulator [Litorivivens lipolytica]MBB3047664.1 DNA-binding transcriptional LysR family regulator [Litorivivens lipolytica]